MEKIERLTTLLLNLNSQNNTGCVARQDREFLAEVNAEDMALAQEKLLSTGLEAAQLTRLWDTNSSVLPDQVSRLRTSLPAGHIIRKILAEHELILCFICELEDTVQAILDTQSASSASSEVRRLAHLAGHLVALEQHREREDDIIYPVLRDKGYQRLMRVISSQHLEISRASHKLKTLVWQVDGLSLRSFKTQLSEIADYLVPAMRTHIFIESNIVFPLAVGLVKDQNTWHRMKALCEEIGYCALDGK